MVLDVGGVGYKVFITESTKNRLVLGEEEKLFTYYNVRENAIEIYGFKSPEELNFFELLISVSGVGPKSALSIMETANLNDLAAAIQEGRPDLLTQASGIGRKTAERIAVELKGKVGILMSGEAVQKMEKDTDLVEVLVGLGYRRAEAKDSISKISNEFVKLEDRLKEALKNLNSKK